MKQKEMIVVLVSALLVSIVLVTLIFCVFFEIQKEEYYAECEANITLALNKVVKHEVIYPTELLSVDLAQKTATIRVKLPEEGWKEYKGQEKEEFEGIGYYFDSINDNQINIIVMFPRHGHNYRLECRWK